MPTSLVVAVVVPVVAVAVMVDKAERVLLSQQPGLAQIAIALRIMVDHRRAALPQHRAVVDVPLHLIVDVQKVDFVGFVHPVQALFTLVLLVVRVDLAAMVVEVEDII